MQNCKEYGYSNFTKMNENSYKAEISEYSFFTKEWVNQYNVNSHRMEEEINNTYVMYCDYDLGHRVEKCVTSELEKYSKKLGEGAVYEAVKRWIEKSKNERKTAKLKLLMKEIMTDLYENNQLKEETKALLVNIERIFMNQIQKIEDIYNQCEILNDSVICNQEIPILDNIDLESDLFDDSIMPLIQNNVDLESGLFDDPLVTVTQKNADIGSSNIVENNKMEFETIKESKDIVDKQESESANKQVEEKKDSKIKRKRGRPRILNRPVVIVKRKRGRPRIRPLENKTLKFLGLTPLNQKHLGSLFLLNGLSRRVTSRQISHNSVRRFFIK